MKSPALQKPNPDSSASQPTPPICTDVFYSRTQNLAGGALAVAPGGAPDLRAPIIVHPTANTIVSLSGGRVHWVQPLYAGGV